MFLLSSSIFFRVFPTRSERLQHLFSELSASFVWRLWTLFSERHWRHFSGYQSHIRSSRCSVTCRPGNPENGGQTRSGCVGPSWAFIRKNLSFVSGNGFKFSFSHRRKTHFSLLKGRLLLQDFKTVNCNLDDAHWSSQTTYEDKVSRQRPLNARTTPQSHIVPLRPLSCRQRMLTNLLIPVYIN